MHLHPTLCTGPHWGSSEHPLDPLVSPTLLVFGKICCADVPDFHLFGHGKFLLFEEWSP